MAGKMTNPFLIKTGFSAVEIANIVKVYGLIATLIGTFVGGLIVHRLGIIKSLWIGGILQMLSNLAFSIQALAGHDNLMLAATIGIENFCSGLGAIVFVAYISSLCSSNYTATQYALLSSLAVTGRTFFSGYSGIIAGQLGWFSYFIFTTIVAIHLRPPVLTPYVQDDWLIKIRRIICRNNFAYSSGCRMGNGTRRPFTCAWGIHSGVNGCRNRVPPPG